MFIRLLQKQIRKQQARQTAFVALFVVALLFAQLATIHHDIDHASHQHTHLCDAFTAYGHGKSPLANTGFADFSAEIIAVFYAFVVLSPLHAKSSVTRIRGPPSLSV